MVCVVIQALASASANNADPSTETATGNAMKTVTTFSAGDVTFHAGHVAQPCRSAISASAVLALLLIHETRVISMLALESWCILLTCNDSSYVMNEAFFIRPSYTNIRTPCRASNEGDLPPGIGAQTRPLTCSCQETLL